METRTGPSKKPYELNRWIFRNSSPVADKNGVSDCYGPKGQCPVKIGRSDEVSVVPYFNWLDDSFLLFRIDSKKRNMGAFSWNYEQELHNLMNHQDIVGFSDVVSLGEKGETLVLVEYKEFPPNLVASYRKKEKSGNSDIAIVQYRLIRDSEGTAVELAPIIRQALSYLPAQL